MEGAKVRCVLERKGKYSRFYIQGERCFNGVHGRRLMSAKEIRGFRETTFIISFSEDIFYGKAREVIGMVCGRSAKKNSYHWCQSSWREDVFQIYVRDGDHKLSEVAHMKYRGMDTGAKALFLIPLGHPRVEGRQCFFFDRCVGGYGGWQGSSGRILLPSPMNSQFLHGIDMVANNEFLGQVTKADYPLQPDLPDMTFLQDHKHSSSSGEDWP